MAAWISATLRFTSASGKVGDSTTSASRSRPSARSRFSTDSEAVRPSRPAPASRLPPTNSMAASISGPVRRAVPRVSSGARQVGEPGAVVGSNAAPAPVRTRTATIGTAGRSATSSTMPFGRTSRWASGRAARAGDTRGEARP